MKSPTIVKTIFSLGIAALLLVASANAAAEERAVSDEEFNAAVSVAVEHYNAQRYEPAIESFRRAYAMRPQPELIYNIARVYERSVQREEAIQEYERFLSLPNTTATLRARAATSLEALRTEMAVLERAERPQQERDNQDANSGASSGGTGGGTPPPPPPPVDPEPSNAGAVIGWLLVGSGAAALITGGVLGGLALSAEGNAEGASSLQEFQDEEESASSLALGADILFGAGGALAIAGIVMLIIRTTRGDEGDEESELDEENEVSLMPLFLGQNGLGLTLSGQF